MKRLIFLFAAIVIGIGACVAAKVVVVDGTNVRLRYYASTQADVYCDRYGNPIYPARGAQLTFLDVVDNFYAVEYNGARLYISRDYCHLKDVTPAVAKSYENRYVVVDGVHVRLRVGPSLNSRVVTNDYGAPYYPAKGSRLTYLGTSGNFYAVSVGNRKVYISRDYCHLSK